VKFTLLLHEKNTENVLEQGAEENILAYGRGCNRKMVKTA
jgi:hypothetical protein